MPDYLDQPGGVAAFSVNQLVKESTLEDIGWMALQSIYGLLAAAIAGDAGEMVDGAFLGDGLLCAHDSGMDVTVEAGFGVVNHTGETDAHKPVLQPIVLGAQDTVTISGIGTIGYHRVDVIYAAMGTAEDTSSTEKVWDGSAFVTSSLNVRALLSATIAVEEGTEVDALVSPTVPSVPAGAIALAEVYIDPTGAIAAVTDVRQPLQWGETLTSGVDVNHAQGWVVDADLGDLEVGPISLASLSLPVAAGTAYLRGRRIRVPSATSVTASANANPAPRTDVVVLERDGSVGIVQGTPGAGTPTTTEDQLPLASFVVGPSATEPSSLTDLRKGYPFNGDHIDDDAIDTRHIADGAVFNSQVAAGSLNASRLAFDLLKLDVVSVGTETLSDTIDIIIQVQDASGNNHAAVTRLLLEVYDQDISTLKSGFDITIVGGGTAEVVPTGGSHQRRLVDTDSDGTGAIRVSASPGAATVWVRVAFADVIGAEHWEQLTFAA